MKLTFNVNVTNISCEAFLHENCLNFSVLGLCFCIVSGMSDLFVLDLSEFDLLSFDLPEVVPCLFSVVFPKTPFSFFLSFAAFNCVVSRQSHSFSDWKMT